MDHLDQIDYMRQGIGLRGYGQRDPLVEYKREAYDMFSHLMASIRSTIVRSIFRVQIMANSEMVQTQPKNLQFKGADEGVNQFGETT